MKKKDKLYTVNRFNRPAFVDRTNQNVFDGFGQTSLLNPNINPSEFWSRLGVNTQLNNPLGQAGNAAAAQTMANFAPASNAVTNPFSFKEAFSSAGLKSGLKAGAGAAISAGAGLIGGLANNAISGGLESGAGSAISGIGSTVGSAVGAVNPVLGAAISVGSQVLGGLTNAAFGIKEDAAKKKAVEEGINQNINFVSNASSFDDVKGPAAVMTNTDVYKGGWFSGGKARRKNEELKRRMIEARSFASRSVDNNILNLQNDQLNNALANFSAFGGPLDNNTGMGAIGYGFMSDYLATKQKNAENKNQMNNMFMGTPSSFFDLGGDIQMTGADYTTGLAHIDAGGSHEENPNDGVQMGVDREGTPNLVEEGETIYNDYVFSDRILADEATKKMFHLPKKKDITFAEISKRLEKEISERPNDPISKAGFKAQMQTLEDQQERQKSAMEAERARAAFEALSPEEQQAVMQQVAQQDAMAQQAAMQQPSPEEMQMMQQQQAMQADGSQAMIGQEPPMMAEGGHLYANGSYLWDKFWSPVNEYSKKKGNNKNKYQIDKTYKGDIKELENSEAYKAFTDYILNNATDEERQKYFQWIDANTGKENKYLDKDGKLVEGWQDAYRAARNDGLYGIQHYTPEWKAAKEEVVASPEARIFHALEDDEDYIQGELDPNVVGDEVRRTTLPNGDTVIYHARKAPATTTPEEATTPEEEGPGIEPAKKADWMRYAGLFGPAVGLGMQIAGIGKPDYSDLDAAVQSSGNAHLATYKPIGNYLTYRPMDIWYEQNRMDANARATDRAIVNNAAPVGTKMAGLLASGYNNQIANGELYRKALEYNDAKRKDVAEFNRGTDMFNSEAFNRLSQFNASALNDAEGRRTNARLHAAQQKLANDAGWYNSLYGNVSGLFKGISDLGRENRETNWRNALVTAGAFGAMDEDALVKAGVAKYKKGKKSSEGGTVKRKKGKRGLTY